MGWTIWGSNPHRDKGFFSAPKHPDKPWNPPSPLFVEYRGSFSELTLLRLEVNHLASPSVEVKNEWSYIFTPLLSCMSSWHIQELLYHYVYHLQMCFRMNIVTCMKSCVLLFYAYWF
jgi:hypothetical protein